MVFSSNLFLFLFLPAFLIVYSVSPIRWRNHVILAASLIFYLIGSGSIAWILVASIFFNQAIGRTLDRPAIKCRKAILIFGVVVNILPLFYYKYFAFFVSIAATLGLPLDGRTFFDTGLVLPIGISFFTFQAISYLADVYTRSVPAAANLLEFGMYHSLFPQLVAGPIVRYVEIRRFMQLRELDARNAAEGFYRFCIGLGKKVIIADNLAPIVDRVFGSPASELSASVSWLAIFCFSLQIYFDFSGYSDMAIGLGRLLGFRFPENFDRPYGAQSVTEFWRRWHMTLTRWLRDYVYIPLGGNRSGIVRTYVNLCLVFLLCGLWHGAAMTFVIWGAYHGLLLTIERILRISAGWAPRGIAGAIVTFLLVTIGWVPFRAASVSYAGSFLAAMAGRQPGVTYYPLAYYLTPANITYIALGIIVAIFPFGRLQHAAVYVLPFQAVRYAGAVTLFALSILMLSANSFRPFIYFQF